MSAAKVAVVGHCASGKSSVVESLRALGFDAYSVAQEHSIVRDLWNHQLPEYVIFLDVGLDAIRERRKNPAWPEWIYAEQEHRLEDAREHASLTIDTDNQSIEEITQLVAAFLGRT